MSNYIKILLKDVLSFSLAMGHISNVVEKWLSLLSTCRIVKVHFIQQSKLSAKNEIVILHVLAIPTKVLVAHISMINVFSG